MVHLELTFQLTIWTTGRALAFLCKMQAHSNSGVVQKGLVSCSSLQLRYRRIVLVLHKNWVFFKGELGNLLIFRFLKLFKNITNLLGFYMCTLFCILQSNFEINILRNLA